MALLALEAVEKVYTLGDRTLTVLHDITFSVEQGEFVAIMGPSGSGKSTLLHILGCLDVPTKGTYRLAEHAITSLSGSQLVKIRRASIGFIFQNFHLLPRLSALQNVELPLIYSGTARRAERARAMLDSVGLAERARHRPAELSGGEMQRTAIARALVNDPKVVLADEPTGNLDSANGAEIMRLFQKLHSKGRTIIMVTHDRQLAEHAERIIELRDGTIIYG